MKPGFNPETHRGVKREERQCRVLLMPVGPESAVEQKILLKGTREACVDYYQRLRQDGGTDDTAVCVVDGMGAPVYACS